LKLFAKELREIKKDENSLSFESIKDLEWVQRHQRKIIINVFLFREEEV
jgi:hypothetical protein